TNPGPGEIDLRYVPRAGTAGSMVDPDLIQRMRECLRDLWRSLGTLATSFPNVHGFRELRSAVVTLQMLVETGQLDGDELIKGVKMVIDLGEEVASEVDLNAPELNT